MVYCGDRGLNTPRAARDRLIDQLVDAVLSKRVVKTFAKDGVDIGVFCYEDGYYVPCYSELENAVYRMCAVSSSKVRKIMKEIRRKTRVEYSPVKHSLIFRDKVFLWDRFTETGDLEGSIVEPSRDLVVEHMIPWRLNTGLFEKTPSTPGDIISVLEENAPSAYRALVDWVKKPGEREEDTLSKTTLLLEAIGYTLYPHDYPLHSVILAYGKLGGGKLTFTKLIQKITGEIWVTTISRFNMDMRQGLLHRRLWFKAPISSRLPSERVFRQITGEEPVEVSSRVAWKRFTWVNYAKAVLVSYNPGIVKDVEKHPYRDRWITIEFPNTFMADYDFFSRTFTDSEVEALIPCALHAFRLVLKRGGFTRP